METQKILNLLDVTDNASSKFETRMWYVINDQNNTKYGEGNENDSALNLKQKLLNQIIVIIQMHTFF